MDNVNGDQSPRPAKRRRAERVTAACDLCKSRKVKCNGAQPCAYCVSRDRASSCIFSGPAIRERAKSRPNTPQSSSRPAKTPPQHESSPTDLDNLTKTTTSNDYADAAVPLEGRLLLDTQGKHIFIGDCAPLSFLQTVKNLLSSEIDSGAIQLYAVRDCVVQPSSTLETLPIAAADHIKRLTDNYTIVSSGLTNLFHNQSTADAVQHGLSSNQDSVNRQACNLVLAIGAQDIEPTTSLTWFSHAQDVLLKNMCSQMTIQTTQGFALMTLYMLRASQPNGAYLFLSLAVRIAYAIGMHRAEANASFGRAAGTARDEMWKSLRCLDVLVSLMLGRPSLTSDLDCTVKYHSPASTDISCHLLDASVQIFIIMERVAVDVYSRKRISLRIANLVSHQLKTWASRWLRPLTTALTTTSKTTRTGACQTLTSYYYAITLLTRPFLLYDLNSIMNKSAIANNEDDVEKRRFADAALEAGVACVDMINKLICTGDMPSRMPLITSWLFSTSLVVALGVIGRGRDAFEQSCRDSISCLDFFARGDPHAGQYSSIAQNLLRLSLEYLEKKEVQTRAIRKQASSQLFGILSPEETAREMSSPQPLVPPSSITTFPHDTSNWNTYNEDFFTMSWPPDNDAALQDFLQPRRQGRQGSLADIPLFPIDDSLGLLIDGNGDLNGFAPPRTSPNS